VTSFAGSLFERSPSILQEGPAHRRPLPPLVAAGMTSLAALAPHVMGIVDRSGSDTRSGGLGLCLAPAAQNRGNGGNNC
jgi:hypothetical protein